MSIREILAPWLKDWAIDDPSVLAGWIDRMRRRTLAPGSILVRSGQTCHSIYLLQSGLLRLYYVDAEGRERNKAFYGAGAITGPVSAILSESRASFTIEALEPTICIEADLLMLMQLAPHHPPISRLVIKLLSDAFTRNEQREALLLTCNAEQRYRWLLEHQPDLAGRIPQYHIASYLGIDAVSLSRLKRKLDNDG